MLSELQCNLRSHK